MALILIPIEGTLYLPETETSRTASAAVCAGGSFLLALQESFASIDTMELACRAMVTTGPSGPIGRKPEA